MKNKVLNLFELEELEKRFEMGWGRNIANGIKSKMGNYVDFTEE